MLKSLRQVETYLDEEIRGTGGVVKEVVRSGGMCLDGCWEAIEILENEAQGR